ncbi:MAG: histone deacetylase, partial [Armatimonadetes bacterium]|nr:histone deacetylase [Armatimonadota bacterium]
MTGYVYDEIFLEHGTPGHPESPERLRAIMARLDESELLAQMRRLPTRAAEVEEITSLHTGEYLEDVRLVCERGGGALDMDTVVTEASYGAAMSAAGSCIDAARAVVAREMENAICLVRPPGHHALPDQGMGFCIFNNVALAAEAILRDGVRSVAVVDFDAHHGNGTQDMFYHREDVLYISLHQSPLFPGTGSEDD